MEKTVPAYSLSYHNTKRGQVSDNTNHPPALINQECLVVEVETDWPLRFRNKFEEL